MPRGNKKGAVLNKEPDLNTRIGKYYVARKVRGLPKGEAQLLAGFPDGQHAHRIEKTKTYQAIEKYYYKDELLKHVTLTQIAEEHAKNITQDQDKGAKNTAIKMALDKIEPTNLPSGEEETVMVILKPN